MAESIEYLKGKAHIQGIYEVLTVVHHYEKGGHEFNPAFVMLL
jgi:hypothetical protein